MPIKISFYIATVLFAFMCGLLAAIVAYRHRDKFYELKSFYLYPLASFTQMALFFALTIFRVDRFILEKVNFTVQCIFLLIEFLVLNLFFSKVLISHKIRRLLKVSRQLYCFILLIYWVLCSYFFFPPIEMFVIQAIFILAPTLVYFFELFKSSAPVNLFSDFSFWISIGALFYFSCTLPIFLATKYTFDENGIFKESTLASINYICYGICFLFIIKAFLCPKKSSM